MSTVFNPDAQSSDKRHKFRMKENSLITRINERLEATGQTARAASIRATGKPDTIRSIARNSDRNPRADTLQELAKALECDLNWLMTGQSPDQFPPLDKITGGLEIVTDVRQLQIVGQVEAGAWREAVEYEMDDREFVTFPDDRATRGLPLVCFTVAGNSYNKVYPPGTQVVVANIFDLGRDAEHGDVCIVQRRSKEGLYEATLKQLIIDADGKKWLWPNSLDPRYQTPLELTSNGEEDDVQITGIVLRALMLANRTLATEGR